MRQTCKFSKFKDIKKVYPGLDLNLSVAVKDGVVDGTGKEVPHNNLTNDDVVGRAGDVFDSINYQRAVNAEIQAEAGFSVPESTPAPAAPESTPAPAAPAASEQVKDGSPEAA